MIVLVVFGAAGSVPKTSRAFVVVVLGFFCSVCSDVRKESIALRFCVDAARFAALLLRLWRCSALEAPELAAIVYSRLRRVKASFVTFCCVLQ